MNPRQSIRYVVAGVLIISVLGIFSWKTFQSRARQEELCATEAQEKPDRKVKTGLPMWESLSRHLITIQR
jgi:predicted negative regulator of RcsB-dependent stress response